jgi:hypothetical protein
MAKDSNQAPLEGVALVKETSRLIRLARSYWDAHNNAACRLERGRALELYETLTKAQKEKIPRSCACGSATGARSISATAGSNRIPAFISISTRVFSCDQAYL